MKLSARIRTAVAEITEDGTSWIEVIPTAEKARNGPWYFTITRDDLDAYAASIQTNADRIMVDRDHEGASSGSTRAAGWFTGVTKIIDTGATAPNGETSDHDALWAQVKWTPKAMEEIRDGEFRFISPEFDFHNRDKKTGLLTKAKEIIAATLTNRPFFSQMAAVTAASITAPGGGFMRIANEIAEALNTPTEWRYYVSDIDQEVALVCEGGGDYWSVPYTVDDAGAVTVAPSTDWTSLEQQFVPAPREALEALARFITGGSAAPNEGADMPDLKVVAAALGLPEDADETKITAALEKERQEKEALAAQVDDLKAKAAEGAVATDRIDQLETALASEKKLRIDGERTQLLEDAVREGRIATASKDVLAEQFGDNLDGLKAVLAAMPKDTFTGKPQGSSDDHDPARATQADREDFEYETGAGRVIAADADSLDLHAKAEALLAAAGKPRGSYTSDEYAGALVRAERGEKAPAAA